MATKRGGKRPIIHPRKAAGLSLDQFTPEEFALLTAFVCSPTLDDEEWLKRAVAHRLKLKRVPVNKIADALFHASARAARTALRPGK